MSEAQYPSHDAFKAALRSHIANLDAQARANGTAEPPARNVWEARLNREADKINRAAMERLMSPPEAEEVESAVSFWAKMGLTPEIAQYYIEAAKRHNEFIASESDPAFEAAVARDRYEEYRREEAEVESLQCLRDSTYVHHVKNRTGEVIPDDVYKKNRESREQLVEDTLTIALKLAEAGRSAINTGPQPWLFCPLTGASKPLLNVKRRAFLPSAAALKRAPTMAALELLLHQKDHRFDQFCTFTAGQRVSLDVETKGAEVREAFRVLHRRISKMNAEPFMKTYGAEIIFRASETGSLFDKNGKANKDEKGRWTLHPHAHTLIHFSRFLKRNHDEFLGHKEADAVAKKKTPLRIKQHPNGARLLVYADGRLYVSREGIVFKTTGEMAEWTRQVWNYWQDHWSIDGALEKVREACKYVIKPADLKALSPIELIALDDALFMLHRVQPLGELREQIKVRHESCLKIVREYRSEGGNRVLRPVVRPDWNAQRKDRKERAERREAKKRRARLAREAKRAARRRLAELREEERQHAARIRKPVQLTMFAPPPPLEPIPVMLPPEPVEPIQRPRPVFRNRVVARLSPGPYFGPITAPALLVWSDQKPDLAAILEVKCVREAVEAARPLYEAAKAGRLAHPPHQVRVHTSPETVRPEKTRTQFIPAFFDPETWKKPAIA